MTNPFLSPEHLNPRITAAVAEALKHNQERTQPTDTTYAGDIGVHSLAEIIRLDAAGARNKGSAGLEGFYQIENSETQSIFEASFTETEQLFGRIDIVVPTVDQCIGAGVNLVLLGAAYERMCNNKLEPIVVLSPNLDLPSWRLLYSRLVNDKVANHDERIKDNGLSIDHETAVQWSAIATLPDSVPIVTTPDGLLAWSIRLIPGAPKGVGVYRTHRWNQAHPTVSEYLSLQAVRLQSQQEPIDTGASVCWLNGSYVDDMGVPRAPLAKWVPENGQVRVSFDDADLFYSALGVRVPVWE